MTSGCAIVAQPGRECEERPRCEGVGLVFDQQALTEVSTSSAFPYDVGLCYTGVAG